MYNDVIGTIKQSLDMLASGLGNLANNPAMPEMVRSEFHNLSANTMANIGMITAMAEGAIIAGQGPQSTALRNAVKYLGIPVEGDLNNLAVIMPPAVHEDHLTYAMCRWSQMFLKRWPIELFDTDGKILKVIHRDQVIVDVELVPSKVDENNTATIDSISYRVYTAENWWDVAGEIQKVNAIYTKDFTYAHASVNHHVESTYMSATNPSIVQSVLDLVAEEMMADEIIDTRLSEASRPGIGGISPTTFMEVRAGKVHPDRVMQALNKGMYHFCHNRSPDYGRRIDLPNGHLVIRTFDSDWDGWDVMEEAKKKQSWNRDSPAITIKGIYLGGASVENRRLPIAVLTEIETAIEAYMDTLFPDAEWYTPIPVKEENE
ncbi:hypothetical protein D9M68_19760 [compost metagenome]